MNTGIKGFGRYFNIPARLGDPSLFEDHGDLLVDVNPFSHPRKREKMFFAEFSHFVLGFEPIQRTLITIPDGYGVLYQPPQNLATGATIEVEVNASDLASPPNAMDAEVYEFTVMGAMDGKSAGFPPKKAAEDTKEKS